MEREREERDFKKLAQGACRLKSIGQPSRLGSQAKDNDSPETEFPRAAGWKLRPDF